MKKLLKKLLLKIGSLLKLGIVDEAIYLKPLDYNVISFRPIVLKTCVSVANRHVDIFDGNAAGFDEYIRKALVDKYIKVLPEHIDIKIVEDKANNRLTIYGYLNILKDENRIKN